MALLKKAYLNQSNGEAPDEDSMPVEIVRKNKDDSLPHLYKSTLRDPRCFLENKKKILALVYLLSDKNARVHTGLPLWSLPLCPTDGTLGLAG